MEGNEKEVAKRLSDMIIENGRKLTLSESNLQNDGVQNQINPRIILVVITGSCVLLAIVIISVGVCLYKRLGGAQYGSGQIRILSEDGSVEEELLYIFGNNGKAIRNLSNPSSYPARIGKKRLGLFYTDRAGNLLSSKVVLGQKAIPRIIISPPSMSSGNLEISGSRDSIIAIDL
ncbi:Oidioi.mRNA.OKI2018_I69.chr2.g8371.t1.cds [Oikopleura dioica]|uniref:Oidioi.mRNA.OKI2018_I69.chr2.g8371.t1.cds n=1 Tax=Oikopleura dioica TaxID=34765 RepID=A0ABN7TGT0_OIKDI|nr:Oidioi.mRNA.OKI2018_I69.chr2.g8371.t1.cds [Oikopleura dioica]